MTKLTPTQREVLRRAQQMQDDALFSRRNFGVTQQTMHALLYAHAIEWVSNVWDGSQSLPYYRLTEAGKTVEVTP